MQSYFPLFGTKIIVWSKSIVLKIKEIASKKKITPGQHQIGSASIDERFLENPTKCRISGNVVVNLRYKVKSVYRFLLLIFIIDSFLIISIFIITKSIFDSGMSIRS